MKITNHLHATRRPLRSLGLILAGAAPLVGAAFAGDWPQFMGPTGDGVSPEKGLLRTFPPEGPRVLWRVAMGPGYGGAAVFQGKVYAMDRVDQKRDVLRCFDLETGREGWSFGYDCPGRISHDGSRSTPAVNEQFVFTLGPFGHLHCLDRHTHQVRWQKNLLDDYGASRPRWAVSHSPVLYRQWVVTAPLSKSVGLVALDQATGREVWKSPPVGPMAYVTPKLLTLQGVDQFTILTPKGVAAFSASDGALLWEYAHPCKIPIPNVTDLGQGRLFVTGGYKAGSAIIQVSRQGDRWQVKEIAKIPDIGGHCHPGLAYQDHIYVLCNTNERADGLVCFDFQGKLVWQTGRHPYLDKGGSILTGDGLIYIMDGREGQLHIVEPSPSGFKSLSQAKLLEGREIWGPLALAEGHLLIRDQTQMKCVDLRGR